MSKRSPAIASLILFACFGILRDHRFAAAQAAPESAPALRQSFANPPADCRMMMRWWWFGPAVTKPELRRELEQMKADGIGGVEIATLYPLALNDSRTGFHNSPYLSEEHIDDLRYAAAEARRLGLRVDITLGSGWPFGGPHIPVDQAAGQLRVVSTAVLSKIQSLPAPHLTTGERLLGLFLAPGAGASVSWREARPVAAPAGDRLPLPGDLAPPYSAIFFIASRTGMTVKRAAVGAEGFVLDHYDRNAILNHLHAVGDRLIGAFGDQPPYAVFSDSLEVYASDWTADLTEEFRKRRGYDITPYLPALVGDVGPKTAAIRHDWGRTLNELANERYLDPIRAWAHERHTAFRSQTYGEPPVNLWSNSHVDLPEGEGKSKTDMWRQFSDTRWAASASHLLGKPVASSETWTWLHSPPFRATPLDMKAEADLHFLQGINQLIGHGWPYSPESAGEPGWHMYAAAAFNDHNPWHFAMPDLAGYVQRVSYALRLGKPASQVALLLPEDDAWAQFNAGAQTAASVTSAGGYDMSGVNVSTDDSVAALLPRDVIPQILDAGYNLDFIDADAIDAIGIPYPALVLPNLHRLPLATYRRIEEYARRGGVVIATGSLPSEAPGWMEAERDGPAIRRISQELFGGNASAGHLVPQDGLLGAALARYLAPDAVFSPASPDVGFLRRKLPQGDLYFVANTSNQPRRFTAKFRTAARAAEWWDPFTGAVTPVDDPQAIAFDLQPYESRIVFFSDEAMRPHSARPKAPAKTRGVARELELRDWQVYFPGAKSGIAFADLHSWTEDPRYAFYSGRATYEKTFDLPVGAHASRRTVLLDFGPGAPVGPIPTDQQFNMRAYLESPVREAAEVFVNGRRAGFVWHPPFRLDVSGLIQPGHNTLRIVVGNTAINAMAGRALPDYRLLNDRYGERFIPQDMNGLKPLPSGMLQAPKLVIVDAP